ncbi:aromatic-rich family protein [Trichinella spiralis]|uniref:aromatic-rich family protein n=1 Tax=Trichinella spiralis TaxID=6334 RepID=UPI0001EFCC5F|nr:aromatic-rich family protein [Trichinella spiralis]
MLIRTSCLYCIIYIQLSFVTSVSVTFLFIKVQTRTVCFELASIPTFRLTSLCYSAEQMYKLAADVVHYKDFVPWCTDSKVIRHISTNCAEVELSVGFPPLIEKYTSLVTFSKPKMVKSVSQDSRLFHYLMSTWQFHPNADDPDTCVVHFSVITVFNRTSFATCFLFSIQPAD